MEAAETTLRKAYAIAPYDLKIMYQLYLTLEQLEKTKEAKEMYAKWERGVDDVQQISQLMQKLNKGPNNAETRRQIALHLFSSGLTDRGFQWLLASEADDQTYIPTHESLAEYYDKRGDTEKARKEREIIKLLQQQQKSQPSNPPTPPK
jgi:tetratricopeptide (TPR) repeat protein